MTAGGQRVVVPDSFPEPMGLKEAAEVLGVETGNLPQLLRTAGFAEPGPWRPGCRSCRLSRGNLYMAEDIRALAEELGRGEGRATPTG